MDLDALWREIDTERAGVADLLESLSPHEWERQSLCDSWTIRDVAAHMTLGPTMSVPDAVIAFILARGSFNRMIHRTAVAQARRSPDELVALLRGAVGSRRLAPGQKVKDALFDVLVHGQDIALPLNRDLVMPTEAAVVAADHVWRMGFPFHARKRLAGLQLTATDAPWNVGAGEELSGPIHALLLLLSGRTAALTQLEGPGVSALASRD